MSIEHELIMTYHYQDDGVWLQCDCTWEVNLGFHATPEDAAYAKQRHLTSVALDELDGLRRWKDEALPLLELLERCHGLLPAEARAPLGHSKAGAVEQFLLLLPHNDGDAA